MVGPRKHQFFPNMKLNPLHKWDLPKTKIWIKEKKREYGRYRGRFREREKDGIDCEEEVAGEESD